MPATNLGGYTKRTTSVALVFLAYCAGNIIGPHAFLAKEAPIYQTGVKLILACSSAQAALAILLRFVLARRNKRRDAAAASGNQADASTDENSMGDLTDFEVSEAYHINPIRELTNPYIEPQLSICPVRVSSDYVV
jgi:hypothetical protein